MEYSLFADESGISNADSCFTIGCVLVPRQHLQQFEAEISKLIEKHNLPTDRELKWSRVKRSYAVINFMIDVVRLIMSSPASFICKVTWKEHYRNWHKNEEEAFYKSYTMLMDFCARRLNSEIKAKIDDKSDAYNKRHEVVEIIANRQLKGLGRINSVTKCDSKAELLIQVADLLTGAVNASHNLWLTQGKAEIHEGKLVAISKIAECLGWSNLHHDTYPNADFNIWHFPGEEYRAQPSTEHVDPNLDVKYITREQVS
ncbi:DUF3800 domain-containing protein [Aliidiomarina soli]|uniref:DUF3800 domain-containing protein n=1 Tax=Aliidiomarina soli TaxID=1928574 RepID=A0A432WF77_9GAMM|nr:DUF3800 domain-containing protein [Aliidiomarina soli]RUO32430.1 hypothetical protein CWE14_09790 [Aliidiomarina soli]